MALTKVDDRGLNTPIDLIDDEKIRLGTDNDLQLYHSTSNHNWIDADQVLYARTPEFSVTKRNGTEFMGRFIADGAVELYHNNSKKFQTNGAGVDIFENLYLGDNVNLKLGTGADFQLYHDGSRNTIQSANSHNIEIKIGSNTVIKAGGAGEAQLLYSGNKKIETKTNGAEVTGNLGINVASPDSPLEVAGTGPSLTTIHHSDGGTNDEARLMLGALSSNPPDQRGAGISARNKGAGHDLEIQTSSTHSAGPSTKMIVTAGGHVQIPNDSGRLQFGASQDLQIYHDGSNSRITDSGTGGLLINSSGFDVLNAADNEYMARFIQDSGVELYNNNEKKWATGSNGVYHDHNGTLHENAIHFQVAQNSSDYATLFGVTNYPDHSSYTSQSMGHWARIQAKGGCVVVINSDASNRNDGRNGFDHFSVYQRAGESTNGKRLFSVDGEGAAQFGRAGIRIDNSWGGQPSITVQRNNNDGTDNTDNAAYMRVHGIGETHETWTGAGSAGADFSANFIIDGSTYATSDRRAKTDIVDCPYGLDVVNKLQPRKYQLVNSQLTPQGDDNINLGFIAQEIKEHIPECVNYLGDEANTPNEKGWARAYALDIGEVIPVLVKAIQELSAQVTALKAA